MGGLISTLALASCGEGGDSGGGIGAPGVPPGSPTPTPTPATPPLQSRNTLNILTLGMSVFLGDDLVGPNNPDRAAIIADNTPTRYFTKALLSARPAGRAVTETNAAVGGSFDHETPNQYARASTSSYDIVFLGLGMNSGSVYGVHGRGPNAAFTKEKLRALLQQIKSSGAKPLICNTIHPWPEKTTPDSVRRALFDGIAWPPEQQTLLYGGPLSFDQGASTFGSPSRNRAGLGLFERDGGQLIGPGSQLKIDDQSGANAGIVMTVRRSVDGTLVEVEPGSIQQSGPFFGVVRHFDPPIDDILVPPPAKQIQKQDWTGDGRPVDGLASYATWNSILADLAREEDVKLIDFEYRGFKWVERNSWAAVYSSIDQGVTFETYNHPQWSAQRVIYGEMMAWLAGQLDANGLAGGYERLRGPQIS